MNGKRCRDSVWMRAELPARQRPAAHLQALNDALDNLMLKAAVLSLCVLTYRDDVHIVVSGLVARYAEARPDVGKKLELFPEGEVERAMAFADGSCHGPFQPNPVRLQAHKIQACVEYDMRRHRK